MLLFIILKIAFQSDACNHLFILPETKRNPHECPTFKHHNKYIEAFLVAIGAEPVSATR